jgi:quercetin dioxygenase-like cupin family protein
MSDHDLTGWQFADLASTPLQHTPDGTPFKLIGAADGFVFVYSELAPGASGAAHRHEAPEFLYVLEGSLRANGIEMKAGHGYAAAPGSSHSEFASDEGAKFLSLFKLG